MAGYSSGQEKLRSLANYISMHEKRAKEEGKWEALQRCKTVTAAKKVMFGEKVKNYEAQRKPAK